MPKSVSIIRLSAYSFMITFLTSCFGMGLREPHSLPYDSTSFNKLANQILGQDQIFEMDDFTRYYKKINDVNIRLVKQPEKGDDYTRYIERVIDSLKVDKTLLNELQKGLKRTQLREFYKSNDSILFRADGFLNSSWGYFYSKKPLGNDTIAFEFNEHSVQYVYSVNNNWKKVAIRP
jgi:hypothetical protein